MRALFDTYGTMLARAIGTHTVYVLVSVAIGFLLGLVLGILLSRAPRRLSGVLLPVVSIFQTIPGLVFIGVLFLWLGMVPATVIAALSVYAMFPVLKNTYTGILGVEPKFLEAAKGCGMSSLQTLLKVELPLAMPTIIAGLRMAAVYTVSWAVLAAMIGLGGLGDFVYQGTASNNNTLILLGAIPAAILAVVIGALIDLLQKKVTPRGLRKEVGR
ncbi:ABC transporter permease [Dysosmobacter sp.]|uniref:ABC transporter permease n=1 Tax=Dysosmobacter sp. TaxID=2591382 RepID=UPI002A95D9DC|nr:ABC transporter permease [Dysosmobacter sp.]MDY5612429.1 ABC transporter permease [Dysosmobacter sp.]